MIDLKDVLAPLRPGYYALARDLIRVLGDDPRIRAVTLTGSIAAGTADAYSDLDVSVVVTDAEAVETLMSDLPKGITDLVHSNVLTRGPVRVLTAVTSGWLRIDVLVESVAVATQRAQPPHIVVFDHDGIDGQLRVTGRDPRTPDPVRLVEEFLRVLGLLDVVLGRQEYFVGTQGVMLLREYLVDLFYLENARSRIGGHKQLIRDLTGEQVAVLGAQPALMTDERTIIEGHLAAACAFLPRARALLNASDLAWPESFDVATEQHLAATAGDHHRTRPRTRPLSTAKLPAPL